MWAGMQGRGNHDGTIQHGGRGVFGAQQQAVPRTVTPDRVTHFISLSLTLGSVGGGGGSGGVGEWDGEYCS